MMNYCKIIIFCGDINKYNGHVSSHVDIIKHVSLESKYLNAFKILLRRKLRYFMTTKINGFHGRYNDNI